MKKLVAGGAIGIAVLLGGSLLAIDRLFGEAGPAGRQAGPEPTPEPSMPAAPLPPPEVLESVRSRIAPDTSTLVAQLERVKEVTPAPPPPAKGTWEAIPVASLRNRALGAVGGSVQAELNELHDALAACFDEETAARQGAAQVREVKDATPPDDETGAISLVLQLETRDGEVVAVDAPVEARGDASDGTLACAQAVLRGKVLAAPGAKAGERLRARYTLSP